MPAFSPGPCTTSLLRVGSRFKQLARLVGRAGGNMSKAARLASIDRTTLYRLMERHSLHRNEIAERDSEI